MKLKNIFWSLLLLLAIYSCDEPDKTLETESVLELDIRVNSIALENSDSYSFTGSTIFCLTNKDNGQNFPANISRVIQSKAGILVLPHTDGEFNPHCRL